MRAVTVVTATLPTKRISAHPDARKVDADAVKALANSIAEIGFINPPHVRQLGDAWQVIAGGHRLAAARRLGLETVPCLVVDDDDLHAELAMIDENLCPNDLSPSERAEATARRKAIYVALHPKTKRGAALRRGDQFPSRQVGETGPERFTAATAKATNLSERVIQRDVERGEKIAPDVLDKIAGTHLNTSVYLDRMKATPPEQQRARRRFRKDGWRAKPNMSGWSAPGKKRPSASSSGSFSVISDGTGRHHERRRRNHRPRSGQRSPVR